MSTSEKLKVFGVRSMKCGASLAHSVIILLVFWLALDLLQSHVVRGPVRPKVSPMSGVSVAQAPETRAHEYGYFARQIKETYLAQAAKVTVTMVKVVPPVVKTKLVAKHPVVKAPAIRVAYGYCDVRGGNCG